MTLRVLRVGPGDGASASAVVLDHDGRWVRRRVLTAVDGARLLVDLPDLVRLRDGDRLACEDGSAYAVEAAVEPLMAVSGDRLARLAWHVGNRHAPCQVEPGRLLLRRDHVLRAMLEGLGARVEEVEAPFEPEGGAYGHGRVASHAH